MRVGRVGREWTRDLVLAGDSPQLPSPGTRRVKHLSLVLEQRRNKQAEGTRGENRGGKAIGEESILCGKTFRACMCG